jgi:hypothetical protein
MKNLILFFVVLFTSFVTNSQLLKVKMHKANDYYVYNYLNQTNDEIVSDPDEKELNIKMTTIITINFTDSTVKMEKNGLTYLDLKVKIVKTPKGTFTVNYVEFPWSSFELYPDTLNPTLSFRIEEDSFTNVMVITDLQILGEN